jgi:hypothetical protein
VGASFVQNLNEFIEPLQYNYTYFRPSDKLCCRQLVDQGIRHDKSSGSDISLGPDNSEESNTDSGEESRAKVFKFIELFYRKYHTA